MSGTPVDLPDRDQSPEFRALFGQSSLGVALLDVAGHVLSANAWLCQLLGASQGGLHGRCFSHYCVPADGVATRERFAGVVASGQSCVFETELLSAHLSACWGMVTLTPVASEAGEVSRLLVCVLDITDRKRSELGTEFLASLVARLALMRDERHLLEGCLQAVVERLGADSACVVELNLAERTALMSAHWPERPNHTSPRGLSLEQLRGEAAWLELIAGPHVARQSLELEAGDRVTLALGWREPRVLRADELMLLAQLLERAWPLVERARTEAALADEVTAALCAVDDPSAHQPGPMEVQMAELIARSAGIAIERQRGKDALQKHSERLRLLWDAAAVLLTTEEPETLLRALFRRIAPHLELDVFLNHMVGDTGELELSSFAGLSSDTARAVTRILATSSLCGDVAESHEPFAVSFIQSSHEREHAQLKAFGLRAYACLPLTADDRLLGTLAFGSRQRDHFEANEIEFLRTVSIYVTVAYERVRLVRELREADRKKDDFIALLAHELRNPLAPLRNGLAVMKLASGDPGAVARSRLIMERQLSHMVRLIDDLLDISRISLNKMQLRRAHVSLHDIVSHALETARPTIDNAEHLLQVVLPTEPVLIDADLTRLAQVFGNLLTNAAKYTPKRGQIALRAEREADAVVVVVEDNGIGLQPESLQRIFGMFSQVDRSFERTTGGLGIGLALVKGLTEMHGGSVRAESAGPGQGSRFIVRLPALSELVSQPPQAVAAVPNAVKPRRRILVADDNRDAVESMATMLRLAGNEVHTANDGIEAVERAEAIKPDIVLMDVGMSRLNGYDATRRIRSHGWGERMVVIAITGWGQDSDRRQSREAGCNEHLVKPVDFAELDQLMGQFFEE